MNKGVQVYQRTPQEGFLHCGLVAESRKPRALAQKGGPFGHPESLCAGSYLLWGPHGGPSWASLGSCGWGPCLVLAGRVEVKMSHLDSGRRSGSQFPDPGAQFGVAGTWDGCRPRVRAFLCKATQVCPVSCMVCCLHAGGWGALAGSVNEAHSRLHSQGGFHTLALVVLHLTPISTC